MSWWDSLQSAREVNFPMMSPKPAVSMGMGASFKMSTSATMAAGYTAGRVVLKPSKMVGAIVEA